MAWLLLILVAVVGSVLLVRPRLLVVRVNGGSMSPALSDGDLLLAVRRRACRVGQVVLFGHPGAGPSDPPHLVKRVAATAGQPVPADLRAAVDADRVPPGHLLVRGDNPRSLDSRRLGWIPARTVTGVVLVRLSAAVDEGDATGGGDR
ncbi:signal peptidase I [Micromonospora purpureochromogenes]|uniref:Signal peptidase I n=1 Tax=Micromonospora purpureochromogenes TaxID=47872 RepID=A0A1C4U7Q4_9ACTN|nr:S26 family signal peptidase [Micromonospora purpureochromogenes]SCE67740.1 signal peptidase I [Micromonospora purpureochromogenes]